MASTYVNDLRLNEMATGDQSGSWGTVTNTNLELIAEAFSFGTEGITTNADTHTTTIADGATDPGRSMFLKYTGTLDSACTITIAPNTVSKLWFIENATSGSQNILISQGSGANITIPPGDTKAIYSDGAGSGAAMVDAFASLSVVDLKVQDDLTVTDDLSVGGIVSLADGTAGAPSLTNTGDTNAGLFFSAADTLAFSAGGTAQFTMADGVLAPVTDSDVDLGTNDLFFKDAHIDTITLTGAITGATDITLSGELDAATLDISGAVDVAGNSVLASVDVTGVATAATFEPDGDTAAGDNAAIGYTAAEGLILTGQGSTGDVTIKNDADAIVAQVPTGTTDITFTGKTTTNEIDLTAIAASIDDTAVDVFVYDTSKDSDGGAWRKRTQNTSWYNEAASATRGSRKEFPAVAVLVYEEDQVTIYDGDDPDMPMWMVFNASSSGNFNLLGATSRTSSALAALNAEFMFCSTNGQNQTYINFITDFGCLIYDGTGVLMDIYNGNIAERNAQKHYRGGPVNRISTSILDREVNDVSMAVMPNSYVDLATGLPRSTIALATANGTTFITDSGDVLKSGDTSYKVNTIVLLPTREVYLGQGTGSNEGYLYYKDFQKINNGFSVATYANSDQRFHVLPADGQACILGADNADDILISDVSLSEGVAIGMPLGLTKVSLFDYKCHNTGTLPAPVSTFIASDYNTGNMVGDIKLATLSDTSTTNVTGAELAPDNTATSTVTEANATTGWTNSGLATFASSSTQAFLGTYSLQGIANSNGDLAHCTFTTVVGQCYAGSAAAYVVNGQGFTLKVGTSAGNNSYYESAAYTTAAWKVFSFSFVATSTSAFISLTESSSSNNTSFFVDAVTVRLAEKDRTYNSNDLQIFGTPTKTVVATGNDLVAYAGFTTDGNYLQQTYNPDFDFTGDFSVTGWFKNATSADTFIARLRDSTSAGAGFLISTGSNSTLTFAIYTAGFQATGRTTVNTSATHTNAYWEQVTAVRRGGALEIWTNGELINTTAGTAPADLTDTTAYPATKLGQDYNNGAHFGGSLALWRVSATAPSPEQIYKTYYDEHVLFQPGAQATLYDDTDAITDVAFDDVTNLLHVGTADGRSTFQGLRRVENTTTAVGTSISASNGLVAED